MVRGFNWNTTEKGGNSLDRDGSQGNIALQCAHHADILKVLTK